LKAILAAGRVGVSVRDFTLYSTTFPCHNCAKHIVGAGISRVVYIEPYAKSLADRLHGDAIALSVEEPGEHKVPFVPFSGVAPRAYPKLFSMMMPDGGRLKRKIDGGAINEEPLGLRTIASPISHIDRESIVADLIASILDRISSQ
jgi:hypothetical protein